eukprot:comp24281_c0_seq1/m.45348 comp24281_c0_seq1/g.45348  ORF comp24281_c0_seq1/g.45348 comp24281_c0_seq1/m.45348 type:complete len:475 (-) comp24281_c0_seq1:186-1610(-)
MFQPPSIASGASSPLPPRARSPAPKAETTSSPKLTKNENAEPQTPLHDSSATLSPSLNAAHQPSASDASGRLSPSASLVENVGQAVSTLAGFFRSGGEAIVNTVGTTLSNLPSPRRASLQASKNGGVKIRNAKFYKNPPLGRMAPLSEEEWMSSFDAEGRIAHPGRVRSRVFAGGAEDVIRGSLWEFLLGVYTYGSTYAEREEQMNINRLKYENMRDRLQEMQLLDTFTDTGKESINTIDKDVRRTDREVPFYAGDGNPNLTKLENILAVHSIVYRPELPYIQGQNEFASMLLYVQNGSESEAFWCFAQLMNFMGDFFLPEDKTAMNRQFHTLIEMVNQHEPTLYETLATEEAADVVFAYRWMLLNMKREFNFEDALRICEVIWSMPSQEYTKQGLDLGRNPYILFICLAVILQQGEALAGKGYADIIMHMNGLAGKLDVSKVLSLAECLYWYFVQGGIPPQRLAESPARPQTD